MFDPDQMDSIRQALGLQNQGAPADQAGAALSEEAQQAPQEQADPHQGMFNQPEQDFQAMAGLQASNDAKPTLGGKVNYPGAKPSVVPYHDPVYADEGGAGNGLMYSAVDPKDDPLVEAAVKRAQMSGDFTELKQLEKQGKVKKE